MAGPQLAGVALELVRTSLNAELANESVTNFKIGISANPFARWDHYAADPANIDWKHLVLLWASEQDGVVRVMEAALINQHKDDWRCRNVARGGEGEMPTGPPFYLYVAISTNTENVV